MPDKTEFNAMDADFLLKHPILNEAFDKVKNGLVERIESGPTTSLERDGIMIGLQVLKSIKEEIYEYVSDATVDKFKHEIEEY